MRYRVYQAIRLVYLVAQGETLLKAAKAIAFV